MNLITNLKAKYDLHKLEQRYTRREKRTTFISGAQYVDGEYVYNNNTGGSNRSGNSGYQSSSSGYNSSSGYGSPMGRNGGNAGGSGGLKALGKRASRIFS